MILSKTKKLKTRLFAILIFISVNSFSQQAWEIPADKKNLVNPVKSDIKSIDAGKNLYNKNCKSCHGDPGMGNGLKLTPPPIDPASDIYQAQTDGEMFYKMTTGRGAMPTFEKTVSENDRWQIINYIRTFNPSNLSKGNIKVKDVKMDLQLDEKSKNIYVTVSGMSENKENQPVANAEVGFFIKRYFGNLQLSDNKIRTNKNGVAAIAFPSDIPGDSSGNVMLVVKLMDQLQFGKVEVQKKIKWGLPVIPKNPLSNRAMWGNRSNAPIWLLLTYFSVVIGIWSVIIYIIFQLTKLRKAGKIKA